MNYWSIPSDAKLENVKVNGKTLKDAELKSNQSNKNVVIELTSGSYEFDYVPEVAYIKYYGIDVSLGELISNEKAKEILGGKLPMMIAEDMLETSGHQSLRELSFAPFSPITNEVLEELNNKLGEIKVNIIQQINIINDKQGSCCKIEILDFCFGQLIFLQDI